MVKFLISETYGKLPVRLSYYAIKMFQLETGKSLEHIEFQEFEILLYYALQKGFQKTKKQFGFTNDQGEFIQFTKENIGDVADEVFTDFVKMIPEFFKKENSTPTAEETVSEIETEKKELPTE